MNPDITPPLTPDVNSSEPTTEAPPPKRGLTSVLLSGLGILLNWFIVPLGLVLFLHYFVFQAFHVVGSSMVPTMHEADYLIISKVDASISRAKNGGSQSKYLPSRGEIIVFRYPKDPNLVFVKRVIALPGERVTVKDNKIMIYNDAHPDGFNPDKSYDLDKSATLGNVDTVIPDGNVFVVGDNRTPNGSFDSREWGPLPVDHIIGKAVARLLPLDKFKIITDPVKE